MNSVPNLLLYWYIVVFISTEVLSYINLINRPSIILINLLFLLIISLSYRTSAITLIRKIYKERSPYVYFIIGILGLTFIQGLFSAPNTTDSMVYHLPRVMYWVQDHTLFQDSIRNEHDFMAPFAEYLILHLYLLSNGDRMLFFSQWLAFVFTILLSFLIARRLGATNQVSKVIVLFVATLPIGVLQATSTQTDMITTIMFLLAFYYALVVSKSPNLVNSILFGFSVGLGMLTKATFVIYIIIPFVLLAYLTFKEWRKYLLLMAISLLIVSVVQIRFLQQNIRLYGNITGQQSIYKGGYTNEQINIAVVTSNSIRNTLLHLPIPFISQKAQEAVVRLHSLIGLDINDPKTTYYDTKFTVLPIIYPQEDIVSNPLHMLIIIFAGILLIYKKFRMLLKVNIILLYVLVVGSFVVFSIILKWQPFHSRLQIPFFIAGTIVSIPILSKFRQGMYLLKVALILSTSITPLLIILNVARPYISYNFFYNSIKSFAIPLSSIPESFFTKTYEQQYFNGRSYWYKPYKGIVEVLKKQQLIGKEIITFKLMDDFEYPLWLLIKENNIDLEIKPELQTSDEAIIISTSINPYYRKDYATQCIKTDIEYGYACLSIKMVKS